MNIMNEYLKINENYITKYFKVILGSKYNKNIVNKFLETYFGIRYYDIDEAQNRNDLKEKILKEIDKKEEFLLKEFPEHKEIIEQIKIFYKYIPYFDNVIHKKDIEKIISHIYEKKKNFTNKINEKFEEDLRNIILEYKVFVKKFLNNFESDEFRLEFKKISEKNHLEEITLKYTIKMPMIYSIDAIQQAFETSIIKEDRQAVEYYLVMHKILKNIIEGDMKKQYIVNFPETILEKTQKLKRLLEIINNQLIQEKITLKVKYANFVKYKKEYGNLIRNGFKIAVVIKEEIEISKLKELEVAKFVLIKKDLIIYQELMKNKNSLNIIEI